MTKQEIIETIAESINYNVAKLIRDRIIRGRNKIISEGDMYQYWGSFSSLKEDVINYINVVEEETQEEEEPQEEETNRVTAEDEAETPAATKTVTVVPFQSQLREVTVPSNWSVKMILDNFPDVRIDVESGMWDVRLNGAGDNISGDAAFIVPNDGDFIQIATQSKGN